MKVDWQNIGQNGSDRMLLLSRFFRQRQTFKAVLAFTQCLGFEALFFIPVPRRPSKETREKEGRRVPKINFYLFNEIFQSGRNNALPLVYTNLIWERGGTVATCRCLSGIGRGDPIEVLMP